MGALFSSGIFFMISAGYFPYSFKNKFTFSEANLSSSDLVFTIFICTFCILLVSMIVNLIKPSWGGIVSLFLAEVKTFVSALHHSHLHVHVWAFFEANESLINCNVFSVNEILVSLGAFLGHHRGIWPIFALDLWKQSYAHKVHLKGPSINGPDFPESWFEVRRSCLYHGGGRGLIRLNLWILLSDALKEPLVKTRHMLSHRREVKGLSIRRLQSCWLFDQKLLIELVKLN